MKIFFLLFPFLVFSQQQVAKGVVKDKDTNSPVPYVNISILESRVGTSSNDDGSYSLNINKEDVDKNVHLSSLGYKDTTLTVTSFTKLKTIYLQPLAEELDEVVITEKFEEEFMVIKPFQKKDLYGGFGNGKRPWQIGLYFPYDSLYDDTKYINTVKVRISKGFSSRRKASKFRVRLYSISQDSLPGQDLISESIIVTTTKKQKEVEVDLSTYNIVFPNNGLFVVLEGLAIPFNEYKWNYTMTDSKGKKKKVKDDIGYVPSFRAFLANYNKFLVVHYGNGKWWKYSVPHHKDNKQWVPAISLTLSN